MNQTFYFLHGEDAVSEFNENGAEGCKEKGFNCISKIDCNVNEPLEIFIKKMLSTNAGSLETCLISEEEFHTLEN